MKPGIDIDTRKFNAMVADLTKRLGLTREEIIRNEATAVLDKCIARTARGNEQLIRENAGTSRAYLRSFARNGFVINGKGQIFYKLRNGRWLLVARMDLASGVVTTHHTGAKPASRNLQTRAIQIASAVMAGRKDYAEVAIKAIGLAIQSWVQSAQDLNLPIKTTRGSTSAIATTGVRYTNGTAIARRSFGKYGIEIRNTLPYNMFRLGKATSMQYVLRGAVNGRVAYLNRNINKGVFDDMSAVAKRYPGLRASLS